MDHDTGFVMFRMKATTRHKLRELSKLKDQPMSELLEIIVDAALTHAKEEPTHD